MAKMIDKEPKYEGEKKVWHAFYKNLPSDWVVYNTRSINGKEYDFCVISPNMGLFIVEVKGWNPDGILNVIDSNTIFLAGERSFQSHCTNCGNKTCKAWQSASQCECATFQSR